MTGMSTRAVVAVTSADSAEQWGNVGLDVLSTPSILGEVERLCDSLMRPFLTSGQMTVGIEVTMRHLAPVKVGREVEYRVGAQAFDKRTDFTFEAVRDDGELVCDGTHRRAVVDVAIFQQRLAR
jgi:predicted thioesterase